ncbi:MAG TPA: hypothetical protein VD886_24245, partial [Herpetosiphonaceae bacterium]|nr:hypothetical protein [Herpetosiphonaceae bacterium]
MLNHTRLFSLVLMLSLVAAFAISGIVTTPLQATSGVSMPGPMITLYATDHDEFTRVVPPQQRVVAPSATTITVNYMGSWDPQAKTAFQYAVDLWESYIATPVPISVDASWEALGTNMLGRAGPTTVRFNFTNAPRLNTWYPIALANALRGLDLAPSESDITANFSSSFSNWYLGTDGNTPAGKYDFVSVVLHELGHGLGFVGSGDVSNGQGQWGLSNGVVNYPMIYDVY